MLNRTLPIFFSLIILLLVSCATDSIELQEPEITFPEPIEGVAASLSGSVEDETGFPIVGAVVTCKSCLPVQQTRSDDKGNFQFLNVVVEGDSGFLSVSSEGRFDGFRRFGLLEGRVNYTQIQLKEKQLLGSLDSQQEGVLTDISGATINLPANGIVDDTGQLYSGDYNVFMSWIDPSSEDLNLSMVGDLSAIDAEGQQVGLSTYGMLHVELETPSGAPLNIGDGNTCLLYTSPSPRDRG